MTTNKILSADLLDLVFDDRNKAYGAYELRKTYNKRITKALLITAGIAALAFAGAALAGSLEPAHPGKYLIDSIELTPIKPDEPESVPLQKPPEKELVRTIRDVIPLIVPDNEVVEPPPTQDEIKLAEIDFKNRDGVEDKGISDPSNIDGNKGIFEQPKNTEPQGPFRKVEIEAEFNGNWVKFLQRNLSGDKPVEDGAAAGRYKVLIQFVVDIDGSLSEITPLTSNGFGMEEEAVRVIKNF
jgi:protein TonB